MLAPLATHQSCLLELEPGGEGDDRGWDGWMASLTLWMWVWVISGSLWWTGRPGVLQFMGLQRVGHNWATELNWTFVYIWSDSAESTGPYHHLSYQPVDEDNVAWWICCMLCGHQFVRKFHNNHLPSQWPHEKKYESFGILPLVNPFADFGVPCFLWIPTNHMFPNWVQNLPEGQCHKCRFWVPLSFPLFGKAGHHRFSFKIIYLVFKQFT